MEEKVLVRDLFSCNRKVIKKAEKISKEYVFDFMVKSKENRFCDLIAVFSSPLLKELEMYYNGEIVSTLAFVKALKSYNKDRRILSYHLENLLLRMISIWEYIFQFLNQYLKLYLVDFRSKEKIIWRHCHEPRFVNIGSVTKIEWDEKPQNEQKVIRKELQKKLRNINQSNLIKAIKSRYEVSGRLEKLLNIIEQNGNDKLKEIRNQVTHQRPVGANFTVEFSDMFFDHVISINNQGWFKISEVMEEINHNILAIRESIQIIHKIIHLDEFPNTIENSGKKYYLKQAECMNCKEKFVLPSELFGEDDGNSDKILCPNCWEPGCEVLIELPTSEINFGTYYVYYLETLKDHLSSLK